MYTHFSLIGCAGSVGISLAGRVMYILCAYLSVVWSGGPVQFHLVPVAGCLAGPYRFSFLWLYSGGYSTGETVRGVVRFLFCFLQFAVSSLGGWISAVGILRYILCW